MITIDCEASFTPADCCRIDSAAIAAGTTPESIAAAVAVRALRRATACRASCRLKMPEEARRKLEGHAAALGCNPGALALFLLRRRKPEIVRLSAW